MNITLVFIYPAQSNDAAAAAAPRRNRMLSDADARRSVFAGQALRIYLRNTKVVGIYSSATAEGLAVFYYEGVYVRREVATE
jgi:hypothetical protein